MKLEKLDHFVLPVSDIDTITEFYTTYLGMEKRVFGEGRVALHFGDQKINLHPAGWDYEPKARLSIAGTGDLCFIVSEPVETLQKELVQRGVETIEGPVLRTGATGRLRWMYIWDPDGKVVEVSIGVE